MPVRYELESKWRAWIMGGCLASEMESAALFTLAVFLRIRAGTVSLVIQNQERRKQGLEDTYTFDTDMEIRTGVDAVRLLIEQDRQNERRNEYGISK